LQIVGLDGYVKGSESLLSFITVRASLTYLLITKDTLKAGREYLGLFQSIEVLVNLVYNLNEELKGIL